MDDLIVSRANDPAEEREPYHYLECGLKNVFLFCGYEVEEYDGEEHVSIHNVYELHRAIGRVLATKKSTPSPEEVRFMRTEMNLTQSELGLLLGVSDQAVARYEKGKNGIGGPGERLLRAFYLRHLDEEVDIVRFVENLANLDETPKDEIELSFDDTDGWSMKEAVGC